MSILPPRAAFPGPALPAERAGVTDAGQSRFDGCLAAVALPRAEVASLLPAELALAAGAAEGDTHPLVLMFGEQLDCAMIVGGLLVPTQLRYWEFCLAIPYVVRRGGRYLHTYVARMYSSWAPVVWDGNARFGYAKERADMRWEGDLFIATGDDGGLRWHAAVQQDGAWGRAAPPGFAPLAEALALPIAGRRADGSWVESYFRLGLGDALLRPARAVLWFDTPLIPGLAPQVCHAPAGAALAMRGMTWRLTHPVACRW
ncbi:MAG TPA: hypothetical protein VL049_28715 [Candidatus Dormibacteraeota bacterium]|nr:hypothetical protein [Candidatus Dormibacteraeota bacterium]